eukprot:6206011-Pleurochrysis_carterae.AAC.2
MTMLRPKLNCTAAEFLCLQQQQPVLIRITHPGKTDYQAVEKTISIILLLDTLDNYSSGTMAYTAPVGLSKSKTPSLKTEMQ